jgi:Zn-dependent protease/predicted transcriptional regulator
MKWSLRIGKLFGIPVYLHLTFLLLLLWIGLVSWQQEHSVRAGVEGVLFMAALFGCVVLHELGHALTARRYGIVTRDITLLPIGGVARLERMPDDPKQELWVALAGPAVNVVIAGVLYAFAGLAPTVPDFSLTRGSFLDRMIMVNVVLVFFNLLPAFPMDGGRVLRALLATRMEYTRATHVAAQVGQVMALLFLLVGLVTHNFFLGFIAFFVWIGAAQEASIVQMRHALSGIPVRRAMVTTFHTLAPNDSLQTAIDATLAGTQRDFPVVDGPDVVGILLQKDLIAAIARSGPDSKVSEVMQTDFETVQPSEMLEVAFRRLNERRFTTAPVSNRGRLVGMITMDNIGEFIAITDALDKTKTKPSPEDVALHRMER